MRVINFVLDLTRRFPFLIFVNIGLMICSGFLESVTVLSLLPAMDYLVDSNLSSPSLMTQRVMDGLRWFNIPVSLTSLMGISILFAILTGGFLILSSYAIINMKYIVLRDLMMGTYEDFFAARWQFFSSGEQGVMLNTFTRELTLVGDAFSAVSFFFVLVARAGFYLAVPMYISWQVTLASIVVAGLFILPFLVIGRSGYRLGLANTDTANRLVGLLHESLMAAKVVLGFGNQFKVRADLERVFDAHRRTTIQFQSLGFIITSAYRPLGVIVLAFSLFLSRQVGVALSEIAVLLLALFQIIPLIGQSAATRAAISNLLASYEQVKSLRDRARQMRQTTGTQVFSGFEHEIALENVSFTYADLPHILRGVTLLFPKGKMVAVVGESGAGKSTLIDLVMGFYDPTEGHVLIDGVPLTDFDINTYRRRIGYVPQESLLFNASIRDNLLWAKEDATQVEIERACRQANATEFIEELPDGYASLVGDRGVRLSGGQIQRLALARAILRRPDLLILDEATSSLDTYSERLIQQSIDVIAQETTVIVIAHRLSTVVNADQIVVLQKGRVLEKGSYEILLAQNGQFRQMAQLQNLGSVPVNGISNETLE